MKLLTSVLKSCSKQIWPEPAARTAVGLSNVKQPNPSVTNLNHLSDGIQKYLETFIISRGKKEIMNESNNFWTLEFSRELRMVIMVDVDIYRQYKLSIWVWVWIMVTVFRTIRLQYKATHLWRWLLWLPFLIYILTK